VFGFGGGKRPLEAKSPLGCCVLLVVLWPNPEKRPPDPGGCEVWLAPIPEKRPPEGADIVVEVPKIEDEGAEVEEGVLPNSELLVAAAWAVSPDGANILVLLFAGCSVPAVALRLEKRPLADEAGVPED